MTSPYSIFNDRYKCIFIHVPKVAGSSIEKSLFGTKGVVGHKKAIEYQNHDKEKFNQYYKFAFIRHPLDRFVSAYDYLSKGGRNDFDKKWSEENIKIYKGFDEFVYSLRDEAVRKNVLAWMHFQHQYLYVCDNYKNIIVDFIGKFENLENDFNNINKTLAVNKTLPHENRNANKDYRTYFKNDEVKKIIKDIYKEDIKLFGYG